MNLPALEEMENPIENSDEAEEIKESGEANAEGKQEPVLRRSTRARRPRVDAHVDFNPLEMEGESNEPKTKAPRQHWIERIVDQRDTLEGTKEYRCQWYGYKNPRDDTWQEKSTWHSENEFNEALMDFEETEKATKTLNQSADETVQYAEVNLMHNCDLQRYDLGWMSIVRGSLGKDDHESTASEKNKQRNGMFILTTDSLKKNEVPDKKIDDPMVFRFTKKLASVPAPRNRAEMLKSEFRDDYIESEDTELGKLWGIDTFELVLRSSMPPGARVLRTR